MLFKFLIFMTLFIPPDGYLPLVHNRPPPELIPGIITYYSPGIMEKVYRNRLAWNHVEPCAECVGFVATLDHENLGKKLWLTFDGVIFYGPYLSIDCAAKNDLTRLRQRNLIAELDWTIWQELELPNATVRAHITFDEPRNVHE